MSDDAVSLDKLHFVWEYILAWSRGMMYVLYDTRTHIFWASKDKSDCDLSPTIVVAVRIYEADRNPCMVDIGDFDDCWEWAGGAYDHFMCTGKDWHESESAFDVTRLDDPTYDPYRSILLPGKDEDTPDFPE